MNKKIRWITETAIMLALLVTLQALTKGFGQLVTGSCVNAILAVSVLVGGLWSGLTIALVSPVLAFLLGIAPQILTVPAIMAGNTVFVLLLALIAGGKKAKVEDRPGVTMTKQWVPTEVGFDLLDMPGVLWPKFEDRVGENLAITGAIRDRILDTEEIAMLCCTRLLSEAQDAFLKRYKLTAEECEGLDSYDLFELVGRKRGLLMRGGEVDHARCADMVLDEFRGAKIGRISLEKPH